MRPKISLIAAMSENRVIGRKNKLPWHLPADWENFHRITNGKPFIMGRKSYRAPDRLLSTYKSVILSNKEMHDLCNNCIRASSFNNALNILEGEKEIFILGGQKVFEEFLSHADYIYLTMVHVILEGDAFFPAIDKNSWKLVREEFHKKDRINPYDYTFKEYRRHIG